MNRPSLTEAGLEETMIDEKYFTFEFWERYLMDKGMSFRKTSEDAHFFKGDAGANFYKGELGLQFYFTLRSGFYYKWFGSAETSAVEIRRDGAMAGDRLKELLLVVDAVVDPSLAPLLIGIEWAEPILRLLFLGVFDE